ncbi:ead/Ea22-like family protein [Escherichia coli]|nr:ead/Ea22-like family protein [Escherichia coli]ELE3009476.1 ead/Ea22-like family protein [Escherichia coli]HCN7766100.1 ead/Ea22-like family protein [Escherichia coli]
MSNIDKRALRHSAESIIGILENIAGFEPSDIDGDSVELRFETEDGFDTGCDVSIVDQCQKTADVVRAMLDELERNQQYIKLRDQENEDIALTVGKLRVELEGKDSKIANLTAERDALREGEMGDARHSNTRAAADIYFQLVEECEIPAGGSLVEYVDDMREKLEAAEKRIAELELREVVLPQCYSMLHRVDFDEPYHTEMVYRQHQVLEALHNAGINVTESGKGEAS